MAIKKLCFDDKTVSLRDMYDALRKNWDGYEDLRQTIINEVPHYGNDNDEVDGRASWALGLFAKKMAAAEGPRGRYSGGTLHDGHMYPGYEKHADGEGTESAGRAIRRQVRQRGDGPTGSAAKLR
jgi:formate C-acetyltransferase